MSEDSRDFLEQLKAEVAACKKLHAECTELRQSAEALQELAKEFSLASRILNSTTVFEIIEPNKVRSHFIGRG